MNRQLFVHGRRPVLFLSIRSIRGGRRATVASINVTENDASVSKCRTESDLIDQESFPGSKMYKEEWRRSSIENWPQGHRVELRDRSELPSTKQDKSFHPFFDMGRASLDMKGRRRRDERVFPAYYKDPSLEKASINKQIYNLLPKFTLFHRFYEEEKKARRKLPVPVSLTGLGLQTDERGIKYWTSKLERSIQRLSRKTVKTDNFLDNLSPSVKHVIQQDLLDPEYAELKTKYADEVMQMEAKELERRNQDIQPSQFPYELITQVKERLLEEIRQETDSAETEIDPAETKTDPAETEIELVTETDKELVDQEYQEYRKHQDLLKFVSSHVSSLTFGQLKATEFESELEAWKSEFWRRSYGTPDESVPPSNVPCGGCGAHLHCTNQSIPGYISSEQFKNMSRKELKQQKCSRCNFLEHFNVSLDVTLHPDEYPKILSSIKDSKSLVVLMIDLLDFPASIWPEVIKLIGEKKKVYIVGNKVDLLPRDGTGFLERVESSMKRALTQSGIYPPKVNIRSLNLISAKTGFGVEQLITKLFTDRKSFEDIYLVGCTNVGKSTLFNLLLQSDLCGIRENDLIHRATTSLWPGTTLNTLKFPVNKLEGWQLKLRQERLLYENRIKYDEYRLRSSLWKQGKNPNYASLFDRVGMTFRSNVEFTKESKHPFATKSIVPRPFNERDKFYENVRFFYDTPGTVYKDQILTLLTTEELLKTIPRQIITPRTFTLQPYQSLLVAGLGRIDLIHSRQNVLFTVFCSKYLPIHVVYTHEADNFYNLFIGTQMLAVPCGGEERLKRWPKLESVQFDLTGKSWKESTADLVLSSAGWVSVTLGREETCVVDAYTPGRKGLFVRSPPVLPFSVQLKGRRIPDTPCFETKVRTIEEFGGWDENESSEMEDHLPTKRSSMPVVPRKGSTWQERNLNYFNEYRKNVSNPLKSYRVRGKN